MKRLLVFAFVVMVGIGALAGCALDPQQTIVVTTTADGRDATPGDGICEVTVGAEDCSVRAAVDEANAAPVRTRILLAGSTTYRLTLVGVDDTNAAGDLDLSPASGSITLEAPAPGATIDAGGAASALDVRRGVILDHGVGATGASGSAWVVRASSILSADRATVHANAGAGVTVAPGGAVLLGASTISSNGGPGIANEGTADLRWSTVTRNHVGVSGAGATTSTSSIIGNQVTGADCARALTSLGGNLDSDGTCGLTVAGDRSDVDPMLGPLAGSGPAHTPLAGSPVIDSLAAGTASCTVSGTLTDQRGTVRPNGFGCEPGAIEVARPVFTVNHAADSVDAAPGNGSCADSSGRCTMRAAVQEANARPGADAIVLGDVDPLLSRAGANEDAGATGDLDVTDDLLLIGRGRTVAASGLDRVLDLHGDRVTIDGLVLTGGAGVTGGGGLRSDGGSTVLQASTVRGNVAVDYGGGMAHRSGALVVDRTWVDDNVVTNRSGTAVAPLGGGGLHVGVGDVTVIGSSFTTNSAAFGGGILNQGAPDQHNQLTVTATTIAGNDGAGIHGGLVVDPATSATPIALVTASTIVDNAGPAIQEQTTGGCHPFLPVCNYRFGGGVAVRGSILQGQGFEGTTSACETAGPSAGRGSLGYNVISGSCGTLQPTDLVVEGGPGLGALLGENGSPPVRRPFATSPVLDHIPAGTAALCDGSIPVDQLGAPRPAGSGCEAGAVEGSNGTTPAPLTLVVDAPADVHDAHPADGVCATEAGACTLRAAVDEANAWPGTDAISIASGVNPELSLDDDNRLWNGSGALLITEPLSLDGNGATVDANQIGRVVTVAGGVADPVSFRDVRVTGGASNGVGGGISGHELVLDGVVVEGNGSTQDAGGVFATHLVATDSEFRDNTAGRSGGAIWAITADLDRVVVQGNESSARGGGIYLWIAGTINDSSIDGNRAVEGGGFATADPTGGSYTVDITRSTFANNSATSGGGVFVADAGRTVQVASSTIVSNTATTGAAIGSVDGTTVVDASTLAGNVASSSGGVVGGGSGSVLFRGSIVTSGGIDCAPGTSVTSAGYNVGADGSCALADATDLASVDPLLGPLADNGGPTPTRLPFDGSPVLDRIPAGLSGLCDASTSRDQRDVLRPAGSGCDVGSVEGSSGSTVVPLDLVVNDAGDVHDADLSDGLCATAAAGCTLRAAIDQTNAHPGEDEITIAPGIDPVLSIAGRDEGSNATGDLDIRDAVVIHGGGATVWGAGLDRVLDVAAPTRLERLTVAGGDTGASASPDGGNVLASADLGLENVTVTLGSTRGRGAGLAVTGGTTTVVASTFSLGSTDTSARAISVAAVGAQVTMAGSVVDGPLPLCAGPVTSLGRNVVGDGTCGAGPTDAVGAPLIGPLRAIGGFDVHLPYTSSPAINAVPAGTPGLCDGSVPTDERGAARPASGACDAGATEGSVGFGVPAAATITVTSSADAIDTNPGDGACVATGGGCTLRAAIDEANARPGPDTIAFDSPRTVTLTRAGAREAGNRTGDLDVVGDLTLLGSGSVVDANNLDRVVHQRTGVLHAEQITLRRGRVADPGERGGNVLLADGGSFDRSVIAGGRLTGGGQGGGIASLDGAVTLTRSTVSDNAGAGFSSVGGGIWAASVEGDDLLVVTASTITGNSAFTGAALFTVSPGSFMATVTASTIAGGAGYTLLGGIGSPATEATGSIIDFGGVTYCGALVSGGWNVFTAPCWTFPATGLPTDVVAPSGLAVLGPNGGPTPTRPPTAGSAPIGSIPFGTAGLCDAATAPDQRGVPRPVGPACDAGAVEQ